VLSHFEWFQRCLNNDDADSGYNVVLHELVNDINKFEGTVSSIVISVCGYSVVITCGRYRDVALMYGGQSVRRKIITCRI